MGAEKEKIAGHEREHFRGFSLETSKRKVKRLDEILKKSKETEIKEPEKEKIREEGEKLWLRSEIEAETQRIFRYSENVNDVIDALAIRNVCTELIYEGVEKGLKQPSPEENLAFYKSLYPYLKEKIIKEAVSKEQEIRDELKTRYEKWKQKKLKYKELKEGRLKELEKEWKIEKKE